MRRRRGVERAMEGEETEEEKRKKAAQTRVKYSCDQCDRSFTFQGNLRRHIIEAHTDGPHKCDVCFRTYSRKSYFRRHKCDQSSKGRNRNFRKEKPLRCGECDRAFAKPDSLAKHVAFHNSSSALNCDVCNKTFTDKHARKRHMTTHTSFHACDGEFMNHPISYSPLIAFPKDLESDGRFECVQCGRKYIHKGNLTRHLNSCQGSIIEVTQSHERTIEPVHKPQLEPPLLLPSEATDLRLSYKLTNAVRRYECKECGRRFTTAYILKNHLVTHSNTKQYKCNECGKAFARKDVLSQHLNNHFAARNIICDYCGKAFHAKSLLRQHIAIHLPPQYKCGVCGREFTYKGLLQDHTKKIHSEKK